MRWREAARRAAETARLMVGLPDYDRYLAHRRARHPGEPAMSRAEFHRERTERRFGAGTSRCC
ncbi:MAG TPA: YbdD/YjiX family protein [Allosphingosinicella sp.]|jgi:uncharacterized short protein YbdD (DUF466 family)